MCWKVWSLLVLVKGITFERVALDDKPHAQLSDHFDRCADKIQSVRDAGGCTLVHCVAGVSRSVAMCVAYLMKHEKLSLRAAFRRRLNFECEVVKPPGKKNGNALGFANAPGVNVVGNGVAKALTTDGISGDFYSAARDLSVFAIGD